MTFTGVLGIFQQSEAADDRVAPLECSRAAQDHGTLSGTVSDILGTGISGALISASCGALRQAVTTDSIGAYNLQLSPGRYRVRVSSWQIYPD
jgi:hypothetical protein